jgi:hypothetical protein
VLERKRHLFNQEMNKLRLTPTIERDARKIGARPSLWTFGGAWL